MGFESQIIIGRPKIDANGMIHTTVREYNGKYTVTIEVEPQTADQFTPFLCIEVYGDKLDLVLNTQNGWKSILSPTQFYKFHCNVKTKRFAKKDQSNQNDLYGYINGWSLWKVEPVMAANGALPPAPQTTTAPNQATPPTYQAAQMPMTYPGPQVSAPMPTAAPNIAPPARPAIPTVPQGCSAAQLDEGHYWTQTGTGVQMYYDANTNTWITPQQPATQSGNNAAGGVDDLPF
jgi:hypothetical protein